MANKNAQGLVAYCKAQVGKPYWYGTLGQYATEELWQKKAEQYPKYYGTSRRIKAQKYYTSNNVKVHDCAGLVKGYLMSASAEAEAVYNSAWDLTANGLYNKAPEKGPLKTLPEIPGIGLWKNNHFGVYIGGGLVIEARGFDYGVIQVDLKDTTFTSWCKIPGIDYSAVQVTVETDNTSVKKGTNYVKGIITASVLNIRSGKSMESPIVATIGRGEVVELLDDGSDGWYKITNGYIYGKYVSTLDSRCKTVNVSSFLNVRSGAGTTYSVIGRLTNGIKVVVNSTSNGWCKIEFNGDYGYVASQYLK